MRHIYRSFRVLIQMSNQTAFNLKRVDLVGSRLIRIVIELSNKADKAGSTIKKAKQTKRRKSEPQAS